MGVVDMTGILAVEQDIDKVVVVVYNMVRDIFSCNGGRIQEHMVRVVQANQGILADQVVPYIQVHQVDQVVLSSQVHRDILVDQEDQVALHNNSEYRLVRTIVGMGQDIQELEEL